jgi:linoleoyl-CoA desaturase
MSATVASSAAAVSNKLKFEGSDAFFKTVRARVDQYFQTTGRSPRDCWQMYLKTAVIFSWFVSSYLLLVFATSHWYQAIPLAVSLGFAMAAIGFNIQHDGGPQGLLGQELGQQAHGHEPRPARRLQLRLGPQAQHRCTTPTPTSTSTTTIIEVGFLGRLAPDQPRLKFHRLQHVYLWALYGLLPVKWHIWDDFFNIARGRIGSYKFSRPKGWNLAVFLGGKALFFFLAFGLPLLFHKWYLVVGAYLLTCTVMGIMLSIVFQLAHVVEEAEFPLPNDAHKIETHWAVHQVLTTVDFARRNPVLCWFLGGLNFQIEHHLFPRICHIHYPRISKLVEETCREFGIQYHAHKTFFAGVASHFRWLRQMGRPTPA